jgi:hypothetical protein
MWRQGEEDAQTELLPLGQRGLDPGISKNTFGFSKNVEHDLLTKNIRHQLFQIVVHV